ncbi:MAG: hypothetical protein IJS53_03825, partial [Clostridia bacterium]|nr:hypothetical protein [Clostridia bacterium]
VSLRALHAAARAAARMAADALHSDNVAERALYAELSLILSEHATQYGGLLGQPAAPERELALRAWAACGLYRDLALQEEDADLRAAFGEALDASLSHLRKARDLCLRAEQEPPFARRELPPALILRADKGYIRAALEGVGVTVRRGERLPVGALPAGADFFRYQRRVNADEPRVPSHAVVMAHIRKTGQDFRRELGPHPVEALRDRAADAVLVGR